MIGNVVDGVASLIWACADGDKNAMEDFQKVVSGGLLHNADNANIALASYIADMKAKAAELEELKSKARDANVQWDKFTLEHSFAGQSQVVFGNPRAISTDVGIDVEHMFDAVKKAYTSMLDTIAYIIDYTTKNHMLMQALGIEMCFILTHESLNVTNMANIEGDTVVLLGTDEFKRTAIKLLMEDVYSVEDKDKEDDAE